MCSVQLYIVRIYFVSLICHTRLLSCHLTPQAISCHYASSHCHYINVVGTVQEQLAKEIEGVARKRLGEKAEFSFEVSHKYLLFHYN